MAAQIGAGAAEIGGYAAASFAVDTALVPLAGFVMDTHGRRLAGASSLALSALGLLALGASSSRTLVLLAALALGLGNGMSNGWIQTVGADLAPEGFRPQFLGVWNLLMGVGAAVGPIAVGGIAQVGSLALGCLMAAAVSLFGALWYVLAAEETLPPPKPPRTRSPSPSPPSKPPQQQQPPSEPPTPPTPPPRTGRPREMI